MPSYITRPHTSHTLTRNTSSQACAPLYINRPTAITAFNEDYTIANPNGRCIVLDSDLDETTPLQVFSEDVRSLSVAGVDTDVLGEVRRD